MTSTRSRVLSLAAVTLAAAVAAACGGGATTAAPGTGAASSASTGTGDGSTPAASGGTVSAAAGPAAGAVNRNGVIHLQINEPFEHLDPQNIYVNDSQAIGRLLFRTLMGWKENPTTGGYQLVPDLAAAMPVATANNTVWTFKLRTGVKYEDGTAVTSQDLKYGVERSMDPNIPNGPQYAKEYLAGAADYLGPSKGSLASIQTPDAQTIVFHLSQPVGTWAELCTEPTFIPVPKAKDTGRAYDLHPVAMGPYKIKTYAHDSSLVLVRNPYWSKATDPLRSQNFAEVDAKMSVNPSTIDNALFSDYDGGTDAAFVDSPLPGDLPRALSPAFADRTYKATTIFINFLAVQQNQPALKQLAVRRAIMYARDPEAFLKASGGSSLGTITQSMVPTFVTGFQNPATPFTDLGADGNVAKAKALLAQAGVKNLRITYAFPNSSATLVNEAEELVQAEARAGITVIPKPLPASSYYSTIGQLSSRYDLVNAGWGYDIPDASTIFPPLFRGGSNLYDGTANNSRTNVPALDAEMAKAGALTPAAALPIWQHVNTEVVSQVYDIPMVNTKIIQMVGTKVKGAYISPVLSTLDISNAYISN